MLLIWKGLSYLAFGLAAISALLAFLAVFHPRITLRFWRFQTRKPLVIFYFIIASVVLGFGTYAKEASFTPEERAERQTIEEAEREARRVESARLAEERKARKIERLLTKVRAIPAIIVEANLEGYQQLLELDPDNEEFAAKVDHYQRLSDETARRAEERRRVQAEKDAAAKKEFARREAKHGKKPGQSAWDNAVPIVQRYLKSVANDPSSIEYEQWWPVMYSEKDGWYVKCDWRAKNGFGGFVRSVDVFIIRFGQVVDMTK